MKHPLLSPLTPLFPFLKSMNKNNKRMNKKTDFQIGMDESKTLQIDQKTGGPQAVFCVCCEKHIYICISGNM